MAPTLLVPSVIFIAAYSVFGFEAFSELPRNTRRAERHERHEAKRHDHKERKDLHRSHSSSTEDLRPDEDETLENLQETPREQKDHRRSHSLSAEDVKPDEDETTESATDEDHRRTHSISAEDVKPDEVSEDETSQNLQETPLGHVVTNFTVDEADEWQYMSTEPSEELKAQWKMHEKEAKKVYRKQKKYVDKHGDEELWDNAEKLATQAYKAGTSSLLATKRRAKGAGKAKAHAAIEREKTDAEEVEETAREAVEVVSLLGSSVAGALSDNIPQTYGTRPNTIAFFIASSLLAVITIGFRVCWLDVQKFAYDAKAFQSIAAP